MKHILTYPLAFVIALAFIKPVAGFARETGKEKEALLPDGPVMPAMTTDTVPPQPKPEDVQKNEKKIPDIIKEVPKSRRQVKPLPIPAPIKVKPIRIIKPKVIKPKVGITL